MLITIENFGAIKYFQFDTEKDLYLIFGKNSVGKSYAISLVYLILKNILELRDTREKHPAIVASLYETYIQVDIDKLKIILEDSDEIDISHYVEKHFIFILDDFVKSLNNSIKNTFSNTKNIQNNFNTEDLKITLEINQRNMVIPVVSELNNIAPSIVFGINKNNGDMEIKNCIFSGGFIVKHNEKERVLEYDSLKKQIIFCCSSNEIGHFDVIYYSSIRLLSLNFCNTFQFNKIYYLPASRSGLYQALSAFGQVMAELVKNRRFITKPIVLPAISEPVADYFLYLSDINTSNESDNELFDYINEIEKEILKGVVEFDNESKKILFTPHGTSLKLDLSATSSMVSEISPIVSYLKYILNSNISKSIIFIEELEAHLHPETQVKLMAVFARLVKDNKIKLVMTSHSNYIFNKASNLVIDNKIDKEKFEAILFESTPEGSIARNLDTDEYGIEDDNFIDTAESIYEEKLELINKLNG
jgi:predicted ATPase